MKSEKKGDESKQGKEESIFQHFYPLRLCPFLRIGATSFHQG